MDFELLFILVFAGLIIIYNISSKKISNNKNKKNSPLFNKILIWMGCIIIVGFGIYETPFIKYKYSSGLNPFITERDEFGNLILPMTETKFYFSGILQQATRWISRPQLCWPVG